jgi:UDP-glucuronate 4-epimerase
MIKERETIFVTGVAGFIGFHVAKALLERGNKVIGIDNLNPYYNVKLKEKRLLKLIHEYNFTFYYGDIANITLLENIFSRNKIDKVCHLAAQAGVRYSIENPFVYEEANIKGFLNMLEVARKYPLTNFVYASSSSVYGNNKDLPFDINDNVDKPISLYGATKKCNELMAYTYSNLFNIPLTGLRYFTVYGPWGRPDMVLFLFTDAILHGNRISVYNYGKMRRNFTYIDDVVNGTISALDHPFKYEIFNIASSETVELMDLIKIIEDELGIEAEKDFLPMQPGDVPETFANISKTIQMLNYNPKTSIEKGVKKFIEWYYDYVKINLDNFLLNNMKC